MLMCFAMIGYLISTGVGVWGLNHPIAWGWAIVNFVFWIGIYPKPFLSRIQPTVDVFLARLHQAGATKYIEAPKLDLLSEAKVASR